MRCADVKSHDTQILGLESGIDLLCFLHAADKESGADQRHQGERDLRDHQPAPQPVVSPAPALPAAHFKCFNQVGTRSAQRREQPE